MNLGKLWVLAPLAYILWWFYELFTWLIPSLSTPIGEIANATWWGIISAALFLTLGIFTLIVCFIMLYVILEN